MIDVAGFRHADDRMKQERAIDLLHRTFGQLFVSAVHRIARLKSNNSLLAQLSQPGPDFGRRESQATKVVILRQTDHLQLTRDTNVTPALHFRYQWMTRISCAVS